MQQKLLPYYFRDEIKQFWLGELKGVMPKNITTQELKDLQQLIYKEIKGKKKYELIHFLLGVNELQHYTSYHPKSYIQNQNNLPKLIGKLSLSLEKLIDVIETLNTLIDYGNVKGFWELNLILKVEKVPLVNNPMGLDEDWQKVIYISELLQELKASKDQTYSQLNSKSKLGLIVLSLIFDSHITHLPSLLFIIKRLANQEAYHYFRGRLFFLVPLDQFNPPKKVFLSKVTETLIYQWTPDENLSKYKTDKQLGKHLTDNIRALLKDLKIPFSVFPKTLFTWCKWAFIYCHQTTSPLLVNYFSNKNKSHSLNAQATQRLLNLSLQSDKQFYETNQTFEKEKVRNTSYALSLVQGVFDIKVKNKNAKLVKQEIENKGSVLRHNLPENHTLILDWGLSLLKTNKLNKFKVSPSQVLTKIYSIARHLIGVAKDKTIKSLTPIERITMYEEVIDQAISSRNKETITYNLRAFNSWLEKEHKLIPIQNKDDFFGQPKMTDHTVNANLISFDEYFATKKFILELIVEDPFNQDIQLMLIALILGFRCGFRSKEIFHLKIEDFIDCNESPQIAIRESKDREIKTPNAKRYQKLIDLMPSDEIKALSDWYKSKTTELTELLNKDDSKQIWVTHYLLSKRGLSDKPIEINRIKAPLMKVLRKICGDETLNFHHLRHSFASWHFLSACIAELDLDPSRIFDHLPQTRDWLKDSQKRKNKHLPTYLKSKKYPFWILKRMGHADIQTTMEHYIHTVDLVAIMQFKKDENEYSIAEVIQYTGLSESTLKKNKNRFEYASKRYIKSHPKLNKKLKKSMQPIPIWKQPNINFEEFKNPLKAFTMFNMMEVFHLASENQLTLEHAEHLGFSEEQVQQILQLFRLKPKYRIRRPFSNESVTLSNLTNLLEENLDTNLNNDINHKALNELVNTFTNRFYPYSSDKNNLNIQKNYHLVFNDNTSGLILLSSIQNLKLPFRLILRHSKQKQPKELRSSQRYWRKSLNLNDKIDISIKQDSKKNIGPNGRIEIIVLTENNKSNHAYYYLLVMISAWLEFSEKIA